MEYNLVVEVAFLYFIFLINRFIIKHVSAIDHVAVDTREISFVVRKLVL